MQQTCFVSIDFCLLNTRSIIHNEFAIKDNVVKNDLDIFALTEKRLKDVDNYSAAEIVPSGCQYYQVPPKNARSGCAGWRFQLRKRIQVKKHTLETSSRFLNTSIFWLNALLVAWKLLPSTCHRHQAIRESCEQRLSCWKGSCVSLQPANSWWF